jgi:hypothetical protein
VGGILGRTPAELARLQVALEYEVTLDGLIVPRPGSGERALCCLYVLGDRVLPFCGSAVPASMRAELARLGADSVDVALATIAPRLGLAGPLRARRFATSVLPEPFPRGTWPNAELVGERAVVWASDGSEASAAWSAREDAHAAECAVETLEPYRRRGLARQVTAAWATRVLGLGRVPFFSHQAANDASRALAASLRAVPVFEVVTLEPEDESVAKSGFFAR